MLEDYLNQIATLKRFQKYDAYGNPIFIGTYFVSPFQIANINAFYDMPVRWNGKRRMVRNAKGDEVVSEATVLSLFEPNLNDKIVYKDREWPILSILEVINIDGETEYWKVYV